VFTLLFTNPEIGIPLLLFLGFGLYLRHRGAAGEAWDSARREPPEPPKRRPDLAGIRKIDPEFSPVLFEDFLFSLYAEVHTARGAGTLDRLSPYLAQPAVAGLARGDATRVEAVVIGALRYLEVSGVREDRAKRVHVRVRFESNYTEITAEGPQTYYVVETWVLSRSKQARSRPPARARVIDCPNCGAPLDKIVGSVCGYCRAVVGGGSFDWVVEAVKVEAREPRPPALVSDVEEQGTLAPTVVHPLAERRLEALQRRDPAVTVAALRARIEHGFEAIQVAWNARDLLRCRAVLSDRLFETLGYWLDAYARSGLRNVTDRSRVTRVELSRVIRDAHYDSITWRVFATGLDYTVNEADELVSGSRSRERPYSEYWTLIRGRSATGAPRTGPECPNCGAPLDINMAGICRHCQAKVTSGEFDWVLSKIEQDEAV
jgi:hypothetical protein